MTVKKTFLESFMLFMKILVLFIIKFIIKAQSMKYDDYPLLGAFNCLFEFDVIQLWVVLCLEF